MDPHSPEKSLPKKNYPEISPENSFFKYVFLLENSPNSPRFLRRILFFKYVVYGENSPHSPENSLEHSRASTIYQTVVAVLSTNLTKTSKQELLAEASRTMY